MVLFDIACCFVREERVLERFIRPTINILRNFLDSSPFGEPNALPASVETRRQRRVQLCTPRSLGGGSSIAAESTHLNSRRDLSQGAMRAMASSLRAATSSHRRRCSFPHAEPRRAGFFFLFARFIPVSHDSIIGVFHALSGLVITQKSAVKCGLICSLFLSDRKRSAVNFELFLPKS